MRTNENGSSKRGCTDPNYCLNGKPKPVVPKPRPVDPRLVERYRGTNNRGSEWATEDYRIEGSMYTSVSVIPNSVFHDAQLSTKAEETYTGWTGSGAMPFDLRFRPTLAAGDVAALASDYHNSGPNSYPISIRIDWQGNNSGMFIDDITLQNYSPTAVSILAVRFRDYATGLNPTVMRGSKGDFAGNHGDLTMNVKVTVPLPVMMDIQLGSVGAYKDPYIILAIQSLPPNGCMIIPPE